MKASKSLHLWSLYTVTEFKILVAVALSWFKTLGSASAEASNSAYSTPYTLLLAKGPHSIDARQLHADVDDHHAEHLPANAIVQ